MESLLHLLQPFLPVEVYQTYADYDVYELFDKKTNEQIGMYTLNEQGELANFSLDGEAVTGNLSKQELVSVADIFIEAFHPDKKQEYELSAIIDLDNPYMISYEKRDDKYGLFLHSEGFTVSISTNGRVQQFFYEKEDYQVIYPDSMIPEEKALETYMKHLNFELIITKFDQEVFKNGDNKLHLSYSVNEHAFDIPADGREPASLKEEIDWKPISPQDAPNDNLYKLIGLTAEHKQLEVFVEGNKRIEIWSLRDANGPVNNDMDEIDPHIIKLCYGQKSGHLLQVTSGEQADQNGNEIGSEAAKQKALEVMFKLFPDTDERFRLEVLEDYVEDAEDEAFFEEEKFEEVSNSLVEELEEIGVEGSIEDDIEFEDNYTFYFHLMFNGVRVDDCVSIIGIGKHSGKVNHFQLNVLEETDYQQLTSMPVISQEEAKSIYKDLLKMELLFVREYDETYKALYTLSYGPSFPKTIGHVRALDAITGKAMYVDVGDATFY
ncbi:MAG: YcdB/YcdC domain-containing protein [Bacillota bacterium]